MTSYRDTRPTRHGAADQLRTLIRGAREIAGSVDRATFNRRPPGGGWSAAECMEHLNATARLYLPVLTEAIEDARERGLVNGRGEGRTVLGRLLAWSQEPPPRFRMSTWDALEPRLGPEAETDPQELLEEFESLHEELIVRINESGDLDRKRVKVRSVLDRRIRLSLGDWFVFVAAHGRRHLWQAEQALERGRSPTPSG